MTTRSGQSFRPRYTDKELDDLTDLILQKVTEIEAKLSEMDNSNFQSKPTAETNGSSGSGSATKNNGKNPVIPIIQEDTTHPQTGGDVLGSNQYLERPQASLLEMANQIIQSGSCSHWLYDRDVKHNGKANTYSFKFNDKHIVLKPLSTETMKYQEPKSAKEEDSKPKKVIEKKKALQILSKKPLERESEEQGVVFALVSKEVKFSAITGFEVVPPKVKKLSDFFDIAPEDLPNELPPMRDVQHAIDFIPGSQLPNLLSYRMNPSEATELKRQVDELLAKGFI
ncbi:hypothetical protein ACH5RR_034009 [Cinchona calisaya]|uniref:Uncharacterized protein n=1 Tax=Cinchona calisaya TaxID=153742 RepID=A0ABD2YF33_9GENT